MGARAVTDSLIRVLPYLGVFVTFGAVVVLLSVLLGPARQADPDPAPEDSDQTPGNLE
jgi:hypothetical protein